MRNSKRKVSMLLLTALLLTASLAACGDSGDSGNVTAERKPDDIETETAAVSEEAVTEEEVYINDSLPETDFGGEQVMILTSNFRDAPKHIYSAEEDGDVLHDALYRSRITVEERFDLKIGIDPRNQDESAIQREIDSLAMAGDTTYDIILNHDNKTFGNAVNGDFLDLNTIKQLDFSKPWWNENVEKFAVDGKLLFNSNCLSMSYIYLGFVLGINKEIAAAYDITVPYDDVRAGTWYFDDMIALSKLATKDLNGDGKMDDADQYGFVTSTSSTVQIQSDFGGCMIGKDDDGYLTVSDKTERMAAIFEKYDKLSDYMFFDGTWTDYGIVPFVDNRALFIFTEARMLYEYGRDTKFPYGVLPFPKFDETQEDYHSAGFDLYWAVMKPAAHHADIVGTVLEAVSCYNYNKVVPVVWETVLGAKLSDCPDDAEMYAIIRDTQYIDEGYTFYGGNGSTVMLTQLLHYTDSSKAASFIAKKLSSAEKLLAKTNEKYGELE